MSFNRSISITTPLLQVMKCKFVKEDNQPCQAQALKGKEYCFFHSEDSIKKRKDAQSRGGANGRIGDVSEGDIEINSLNDAVRLLSGTINDVRGGRMPNSRGNSVGYLTNILIGALEKRDLESKITVLERALVRKV